MALTDKLLKAASHAQEGQRRAEQEAERLREAIRQLEASGSGGSGSSEDPPSVGTTATVATATSATTAPKSEAKDESEDDDESVVVLEPELAQAVGVVPDAQAEALEQLEAEAAQLSLIHISEPTRLALI
eukprot:11112428-Alexandrium_andersonii.AAC.1